MAFEKNVPPPYSAVAEEYPPPGGLYPWWRRRRGRPRGLPLLRRSRVLRFLGLACLLFLVYAQWIQMSPRAEDAESNTINAHGLSVRRLREGLNTCVKLKTKPVDPAGLGREKNARYIDGHRPTLIKNATVWVGEPAEGTPPEEARSGKGYSWIASDILLVNGLIKSVGKDLSKDLSIELAKGEVATFDAAGRPLTSGIVDMHSHSGVNSLPDLRGNDDTSELSADITPYVRSFDGIQPNDWQIQVIKSGGVTTSLVLPGSANNIGGEAFVIKHAVGPAGGRNETSITDLLADPDHTWRYIKMACGENAKRVHGKAGERGPTSRQGESWEFRHAFEQAARLVRQQDDWCENAALGLDRVRDYLPIELRWETLTAVLRGQVHVNTHCYTIPDLEAFVDHSNEFKFPVRAFHHAHQTYLVPEILKRAYGNDPPASALFADNMWYKAEAYVGSEYAGKHLYDNGLVPIYVSDNPVLNAQHVVLEAAKGYRYGLPYHAALASVTTAPAERLGLGQRLGKVKPGFDADVVVWDSDPLSLGATPVQVWIDGTPQFEDPVELSKPFQGAIVPNEDLSRIVEEPVSVDDDVVFTGVTKILLPLPPHLRLPANTRTNEPVNVAVSAGKITCVGRCQAQLDAAASDSRGKAQRIVRLKAGHLTPAFTAFGSTIGLNAVDAESDTDNGANQNVFSRAVDGLALDTKKLHVAHRYGVTRAVSAPKHSRSLTHHGTSVGFLTGASHALSPGAVFADDAAVHYTLDLAAKNTDGTPSISSAVGALRSKLLAAVSQLHRHQRHSQQDVAAEDSSDDDPYSEAAFLKRVVAGQLPLVVTVHSADTIAALLKVKRSVEAAIASSSPLSSFSSSPQSGRGRSSHAKIRLAIIGGAEAHLVADELAREEVGVVLAPLLSYRATWDQRRALTGAPLTNGTAVDALVRAGVVAAAGLEEDWVVRDLGLLAGIAYHNGGGALSEEDALDLVGRNVYRILGLKDRSGEAGAGGHFVVHEGSPLEIDSRVRAVGDGTGKVDLF